MAARLLLGAVLACGPCFGAEENFAECAKKTLDSLPTLQLLDALDVDAWLAARLQLSPSSLRSQSMGQSHLWLQTAMERLVHSEASGSEKVEAFSRFVADIGETTAALEAAARTKARKWRSITLHRWNCRRFDVGAGVTAFIGDSGRVLEFRPNGDIYRAVLRNFGVGCALSPLFRPPFSKDGTPWLNPDEPHLSERRKLEPK
jgi:hypothetical protein